MVLGRISAPRVSAFLLSLALASGCANGLTDTTGLDESANDPDAGAKDASWADASSADAGSHADSSVHDGSVADDGSSEHDGSQTEDAGALDASVTDDADAGAIALDASTDAGSTALPAPGEILITEVMYDPSGAEPDSEWIEVTNTASSARTLTGLTLVDGASRTHVITAAPGGASIDVAPGAFVVLARSKGAVVASHVPASVVVYEYGAGLSSTAGIQLANGATGSILLRASGITISQVPYGGWYAASAASIQMRLPYSFASGSAKDQFCVSKNPIAGLAGADLGTPGSGSDCGG